MRSARSLGLLTLFFGSGACGLTYQVLWLRQLSLVFGVTVYAASTVLAAFMCGLAIGSLAAGPLLRSVGRPLLVFGVAEIGIAVSALATPLALGAANSIYGGLLTMGDAPHPLLLTIARLVGSFLVLLVPTFLMGLTLPVLSASSLVRQQHPGARVSLLYGINTAGAMAGVWLTGFFLIGAIGMRRTLLAAAAANLLIGVSAIWMGRRTDMVAAEAPEVAPAARQPATADHRARHVVALVVFLSGLASLALEVVWFRVLVQFVNATTYAFSTMLVTVLAGIAIGGIVAASRLGRDRDWLSLARVTMATGVLAVLSMTGLAIGFERGWFTSRTPQVSMAAILPAAICMGLALPMALRVAALAGASSSPADIARGVGRLYALNVIGAIVGALAGGFVLLPALGSRPALILLSGVFLGAGLLIVIVARPARRQMIVAGLSVALFVAAAVRVPDPISATFVRRNGGGLTELFRHDGPQATVTVHRNRFRRVLFLDGLHQANDDFNMVRVHATIGHLPMVLHPSPTNVLVVGLGGGVTAGAVSQHRGAQVRVIELSDGVRRAADFFSHVNFDVLRRPNVTLRVDDGRNYLTFTRQRYDVITADIIQPVHAGAGNLYSREYFTLVKQALAPDGRFLQWIGRRESEHYRLIMRTFVDVFPHATLWSDGDYMVGGHGPIQLVPGRVADARRNATTAAALDAIGLDSDATLHAWYTGGADEMRRFVGPGVVLTDDRPLVEYHRSLPPSTAVEDIGPLRGDPRRILPDDSAPTS